MTGHESAAERDPTILGSWIQVQPDNTIAIRTGVADFGQGTVGTVFRQVVAEELRVPVEAVAEMLTADTRLTHDGGISAAFMNWTIQRDRVEEVGTHPGSPFGLQALNVQKVAAFAYHELLERASNALCVPVERLIAAGGVIRSQSKRVTYA